MLWAGTDDGLVWVTRDQGKHWSNVTPPQLTPWSKITQIDASHFDANTAYISVSRFRLDDLHPYIYRTHDGGKHWTLVTNGLPADAPVNAVREDPVRRGLLFAGTERTVYASIDDGANWFSLQRNLPSTSIRDLVVHDDDVVVGTHGRSFWILDDISLLRQAGSEIAAQGVQLFKPAQAYRLRRDTWTDTPLPPEEPAGQNPPDGAIIDYALANDARGPLTIAVYDPAGKLVREWKSTDTPMPMDPEIVVPTYWVRQTQIPQASAGLHRFVWDYRYTDPLAVSHDYPISAMMHDTPRVPQGVLALPGTYTVKLTVDGRTYAQSFRLQMDPRVTIGDAALREQFQLARRIADLMNRTYARAKSDKRLAALNDELAGLLDVVESADAPPTPQSVSAVNAIARELQQHHR
jgi:hypothetical protein